MAHFNQMLSPFGLKVGNDRFTDFDAFNLWFFRAKALGPIGLGPHLHGAELTQRAILRGAKI